MASTIAISLAWWFRPALRALILVARPLGASAERVKPAVDWLFHRAVRTRSARHINVVLGSLALVVLVACTPGQQQIVSTVTSAVSLACSAAAPFVPIAGDIAPFIVAGCLTEQGLAKLAADPSSAEWVNGLVAQVKALAARKALS